MAKDFRFCSLTVKTTEAIVEWPKNGFLTKYNEYLDFNPNTKKLKLQERKLKSK